MTGPEGNSKFCFPSISIFQEVFFWVDHSFFFFFFLGGGGEANFCSLIIYIFSINFYKLIEKSFF